MITEEDLKGLKGVFKFRTRKMNDVLGRDILTCDYWKDICNECKVYGNLDEDRWVNWMSFMFYYAQINSPFLLSFLFIFFWQRIEITTGKKKDVKEALRKLKQLEDIFVWKIFKNNINIVFYLKKIGLY